MRISAGRSDKVSVFILYLSVMMLTIPISLGDVAGAWAETRSFALSIGGGPVGGTFRHIAAAIADHVSETYLHIEMFSETSGGSLENIRRLNSAKFDFAIAYAADVFLGSGGKLPKDPKLYDLVRPVGYLYGAPAQLVVRADSGIKSSMELVGKKVAVGNPGSGAALSAERFFRHLGVWDRVRTLYLGYSTAAKAFNNGRIDAFWVLVGYPNASVIEAANHQPIELIPVGTEAEKNSFNKAYRFYSPTIIPSGTYKGVDKDSPSFQDNALLCVSTEVSDELVYKVTRAIWSNKGLVYLRKSHKAAKDMAVSNGITGIHVPLAKGAAKFWQEKKINIPDRIKPK